jgi:hypothetical protein
MDVTTVLASEITEDKVVCKAWTEASLLVGCAPSAEVGVPRGGRRVCVAGIVVMELEVVLTLSKVVPFAKAQNLSAAVWRGNHSLQYLPTAQQSASC